MPLEVRAPEGRLRRSGPRIHDRTFDTDLCGEAGPARSVEALAARRYADAAMRDTEGPAEARYHQLLRRKAPHERLEAAMALSRAVRRLAEAGIRERHPLADAAEVRVRLTVRLYGRAAATRLFGELPDDAV